MQRTIFVALIFALLIHFICDSASAADAPATQPLSAQQRMESWWADLEKDDPQASRALLNFSKMPDQTIGFFKDKLLPLKISEDDLNKALADLDSDDEAVWKPAFENLEYFDPRLTMHITDLMSNVTSNVARGRLVSLLGDQPAEVNEGKIIQLRPEGDGEYNFVAANRSWWAEAKVERLGQGSWNTKRKWTRAIRAIVLLQSIGTPEAMAILKNMASGHPDAAPTKAAKEAIGEPQESTP